MTIFELPISTNINRTVPKNSFDGYTSSKHRRRFAELIEKIRWTNKLSFQTINLQGKDIKEIQVFNLELRRKENVSDLLDLIDKSIPYNVIFVVLFEKSFYVRAAAKHPHPTNENIAVVDWIFQTDWITGSLPYRLNLKNSLDFIWSDFCQQLSGRQLDKIPIDVLVNYEQRIAALKRDINKLEASLKRSKQFNRKVEINLELQTKRNNLKELEAEIS